MKNNPPSAGKGRPKGSRNKTTKALKDSILSAFNEVGGESYLATVAREDPRTFCALLGKVLPTTLTDGNGGALNIIHRIVRDIVDPTDPDAASVPPAA